MQRNDFEIDIFTTTATKQLSKLIQQVGPEHGPHVSSLHIRFINIELGAPGDLMRRRDEVIWSLALANVRPDALVWRLRNCHLSAFHEERALFQVFFDHIISPLLEHYELAYGLPRLGSLLFAQKIRYMQKAPTSKPWESLDALEAKLPGKMHEYLEHMYRKHPDAYTWISDYQQLVLHEYSCLRAEASFLEQQVVCMKLKQQNGILVGHSEIVDTENHLSWVRGKLVELETRYHSWMSISMKTEEVIQALDECSLSKSGGNKSGRQIMTKSEYVNHKLADLHKAEQIAIQD